MAEIESKFLIDDESAGDRIVSEMRGAGLEVKALPAVEIVDRYFDTPKWEIFRAGWAYRLREQGAERLLSLKSTDFCEDLLQTREEVEQEVADFPIDGLPGEPGKVTKCVAEIVAKKPRELFRVENRRRLFLVRSVDGASFELALDAATITASVRPRRQASGTLAFQEAELELRAGSERDLRELAGSLQTQLGLLPSRLSKFERGLQAVGLSVPSADRAPDGETAATPEPGDKGGRLRKGSSALVCARSFLLAQYQKMLTEEPRAWEGLDPEGVHRMRVATRRMRAALRAFRMVLPAAESQRIDGELKWIAGALGKVRDLDVQQTHPGGHARDEGQAETWSIDYRHYLAECWTEEREALIVCLSGARYTKLKTGFLAFLQALPTPEENIPVRKAAERSVGKFTRRILRKGRSITRASSDEALHALRTECKQFRYILEIFRPVYGKPLKPAIAALKELQVVLGDFQDTCVTIRRLSDFADHLPLKEESRAKLLALGEFIQGQRVVAGKQRRAFEKAWKRFDHKGLRKEILACVR